MRPPVIILAALATAQEPFINPKAKHHELYPLIVDDAKLRIVHLDFELFGDDYYDPRNPPAGSYRVQIGAHPFRCHLPESDAVPSTASRLTWRADFSKEVMLRERKLWYTLSKLRAANLLGRCIWFREGLENLEDGWSYSICVGRELVQYKPPRLLGKLGSTLFTYGTHAPALDQLFLNGSIVQHYVQGYDGRTGTVRFDCGDNVPKLDTVHVQNGELYAHFTGRAFCDWTDSDWTEQDAKYKLPLDRLLIDDVGRCMNYTQDYWKYEYCHPDSFLQFHLDPDGVIRQPQFLLGSLRTSHSRQLQAETDVAPPPVPDFPFVRSPMMPKKVDPDRLLKTHFTRLPVEIVTIPIHLLSSQNAMGFWPREAGALGLALYLSEGSRCPSMPGGVRTTRIIFYCPENIGAAKPMKVVNVMEIRTCEYEVLVESASVCAHPLLRSPLPELPESILCMRERTGYLNVVDIDSDYELTSSNKTILAMLEYLQSGGDASTLLHQINWIPQSYGNLQAIRLLNTDSKRRRTPVKSAV